MTAIAKQALRWTPRVLSILFIAFISLFALDAFGEGLGFWPAVGAFLVHLIPSFVLIAILAAAWRRAWIGAVLFAGAGVFFLVVVRGGWLNKLLIAGPVLFAAALFLAGWRAGRASSAVKPGS